MSNVTGSSLAAGTFVGLRNEVINPSVSVLKRKIVIVGVADATKLSGGLTVDTPRMVSSAEEVGAIAGRGSQIHRLAIATYRGSQGVEAWIIPQAEGGADAAAEGTITVTTTSTESGTIALYVNGIRIAVNVATGDDESAIAAAIVDSVTANMDLPVTASAALGVVTLTAKSKGSFGNDISITTNLNQGDFDVVGVSLAIVDMAGGTGVGDITLALAAMGEGDSANENHYTAMVHGYGVDTTTLNAISQYVGEGNTTTGCYDKLNGRFFRSLVCSVDNDLAAEVVISDGRKYDRTNGLLVVPNSPSHPSEIAALAMGMMERVNTNLPNGSYFDMVLEGVYAGATRWCDSWDSRDIAVRSGISPTAVKSGAVVLQNVITFYRPDSVASANNGYRSMRNISISQNIVYGNRVFFSQENWQNVTIVSDVTRVTNPAARARAKDIQAVKDSVLFLARSYEGMGYLYSIDPTVAGLGEDGSVVVRAGGTGFDYTMKVVYSGEGGILNNDVLFDINFSG